MIQEDAQHLKGGLSLLRLFIPIAGSRSLLLGIRNIMVNKEM